MQKNQAKSGTKNCGKIMKNVVENERKNCRKMKQKNCRKNKLIII